MKEWIYSVISLDVSLLGFLEIEQPYPNLVVGALHKYVSENGHVESDDVLTVKGVNAVGSRKIIGLDMASYEEETTWFSVHNQVVLLFRL